MNQSHPVAVQIIHGQDMGLQFCAELQILYALCGDIEAEIANKHFRLISGGMLLISPFVHHRINCSNGHIVLLRISQDLLQLTSPFQSVKTACFVTDDASGKQGEYDLLRMHFARIFKIYSQETGQNPARLITTASQLLSVLTANFAASEQQSPHIEAGANFHDRYIRIMEFIHKNWRAPITIEQIAKQEFLSIGYLSRFFKQHTGSTLTEYLTELRLQNAARELVETGGTVTEIALSNGFKNVNSFIVKFKQRFGETPKNYRHLAQARMRNLRKMQPDQPIQEAVNRLLQYAQFETLSVSMAVIPSEYRRADIAVQTVGTPLRHTWRRLLNIGYARDGLLAEVQNQLRIAQGEIGFEFLRFHGILDDDMHIYYEDSGQKPYLDFSMVDLLLDFVLSINLKPYIELSFMPKLLAQEEQRIFDRQSLMSMYRDEEKWRFLIRNLVQHCVERYGREQVRQWRFTTMGNNLVAAGLLTQDSFLNIYRSTYESVKSVDTEIPFGGPGGMASSIWDSRYIHEFLEYALQYNCIPDFINTQCYPHRSIEQDAEFLNFTLSQESAPMVLSGDEHYTKAMLCDFQTLLESYHLAHLKIWIEEWNSTLWQRDLSNDTCYKSSWLAMNFCDAFDAAESFGYWQLTDFMEEHSAYGSIFHGGYGLFTYNSIPKSGWYALQLMRMMGETLIDSGDGWIVTRNQSGFQILLTHYCHYDKLYRFRYRKLTDPQQAYNVFIEKGEMEYALLFTGMTPGRYEIQKYSVSRTQGSSFDTWLEIGSPSCLRQNEVSYLKNASLPKYHVHTREIRDSYIVKSKLEPHEIQLILLKSSEQNTSLPIYANKR